MFFYRFFKNFVISFGFIDSTFDDISVDVGRKLKGRADTLSFEHIAVNQREGRKQKHQRAICATCREGPKAVLRFILAERNFLSGYSIKADINENSN